MTTKADEEKAKSDQHKKRGKWSNHFEFFLTVLGMAVGMMNVWRFPYIAYAMGGGSFLIPYLLAMVFIGLPLVFQEMAIGQYAKTSCNKVTDGQLF